MSAASALAASTGIHRIGKFPVRGEIGSGPDGSVWLAQDRFANREVAIKLLDPIPMAHADTERRFQRALMNEAGLVGRLAHPHIVALYDAAADDDLCYLVMEHVGGGNLEAHCAPQRLLPMEQAVEIAFKCALALEHACERGVVHGGLKTTNVLVRQGTDIGVSDFCSGRRERYAAGICPRGTSLIYVTPEQLQGAQATQQTDIYALGIILYRLLTGHEPFYGPTDIELARQIAESTPVLPSRYRPELPAALESVLMRALHRDLHQRYGAWSEFIADLVDAYGNLDHEGPQASDTDRFNTLRALTFFRDFRDVEVWETLRSARFRRFPADRVVIREGDRGESFYVLTGGEVEVSRCGTVLDVLAPGDCFGEMLYFSQSSARRTTTIKTLTEATVVEIDSMALRLSSAPCQVQFNKAFMRILIDRLTWANAKLAAA